MILRYPCKPRSPSLLPNWSDLGGCRDVVVKAPDAFWPAHNICRDLANTSRFPLPVPLYGRAWLPLNLSVCCISLMLLHAARLARFETDFFVLLPSLLSKLCGAPAGTHAALPVPDRTAVQPEAVRDAARETRRRRCGDRQNQQERAAAPPAASRQRPGGSSVHGGLVCFHRAFAKQDCCWNLLQELPFQNSYAPTMDLLSNVLCEKW